MNTRIRAALATVIWLSSLPASTLVAQDSLQVVEVFEEPQIVTIGVTWLSSRCDNKAFVPINLPAGAKGWIYVVTIIDEDRQVLPTLMNDVTSLLSQHDVEEVPAYIHQNEVKRNRDVNLVIIRSREVADKFYDCTYTDDPERYVLVSGRTGYVENTEGDPFFLGIEKYHNKRKVTVKVEVLAVM